MIELSARFVDPVATPPLAPIEQPIDLGHLARMTLGDASLEREVLQLFDRQAGILLTRMRQTAPANAAAYAHTLKGSSRGIGAWRVASAAEAVEFASTGGARGDVSAAIDRLGTAVDEAHVVIAELLHSH